MARNRAGTRFEHDDPTKVVKASPPKPAEVLLAEEAAVVAAEKLPDNFKDALALLEKLNHEPVANREEWEAKQPKLRAVKKLVHKLQQGLPTIASSANDHAAGWASRMAKDERRQLEQLAISNPAVKALLKKCDALETELTALKALETTETTET